MALGDNVPDLVKGLEKPEDVDMPLLAANLVVGAVEQSIKQNQENKAFADGMQAKDFNQNIVLDSIENQTPPPQSAETIADNAAFEESHTLTVAAGKSDSRLDYAYQQLDELKQRSDQNKNNKELLDGLNQEIPGLTQSYKDANKALQDSTAQIDKLKSEDANGTITLMGRIQLKVLQSQQGQLKTNFDNAQIALEGAQQRIASLSQDIANYSKAEVDLTNAYQVALKRLQDNTNTIDQFTRGVPSGSRHSTSPIQTDTTAVAVAIQTLQQSFQAYHQTIMDGLKQLHTEIQQSTADIRTEIQTMQSQHSNHGP